MRHCLIFISQAYNFLYYTVITWAETILPMALSYTAHALRLWQKKEEITKIVPSPCRQPLFFPYPSSYAPTPPPL